MTLPRPRTVRAKLTLTTTLAMGLVLVLLGFFVDLGTRDAVRRTIDAELTHRADDFARGQANRDRDHGPHGPGGPPRDLLGLGFGFRPGPDPFGHRPNGQDSSRPRFIRRAAPKAPAGSEQGPPPGPREVPYDAEAANLVLAKGGFDVRTVERSSGPFRVYTKAIPDGVVQVGYELGDVEGSLEGLRRQLLTIDLPLGTLLAGLASLFVVNRMLRPLRLITTNAQRIGGGTQEGRLPVVGDDEFAGLAMTLNGMLTRLEEAFRLEQATTRRLAETVEQQRRFTADASHELKTPLSTIKAYVGLIDAQNEDDRESVEAIRDAANRMRGLVDDLMVLARADGGQLTSRTEPVDLGEAVSAAVGAVSPMPVEVHGVPRPLVVEGNGEALTRLFINLLDNAKKYADGKVEVRLGRRGDAAEVAVVDHGVGIAPEHLPRLFDRFYRPDVSRTSETGGTGLGLAICKEIAQAHGGTIEVASRVGQGTAFTVTLPLAS